MSEVYLLDAATYAILFEFDADLKEGRRGAVKWTDKPVEAGANMSDFGNRGPTKFRVEGVITAWPWGLPVSQQRVSQADAALEAVAAAMQPVLLITHWWAREVVIATDDANTGQGDGDMMRFAIDCQTVRIPAPEYTTIPASRLKPSVRKRATPKPTKGGAGAGKPKPSTPKQTDWIYKLKGWFS